MSKIKTPHVFTSESVGKGHPDILCDQVSGRYDKGQPRRITSVVVSHQTGHVSLERIRRDATDVILFRPGAIIDPLHLLAPKGWRYEETASYGHFGRERFPWEQTDKAGVLGRAFKKIKAA